MSFIEPGSIMLCITAEMTMVSSVTSDDLHLLIQPVTMVQYSQFSLKSVLKICSYWTPLSATFILKMQKLKSSPKKGSRWCWHMVVPLLLTIDSVVSEGTLRGLAGHVDNGASWSSGLHTTSHYLTTETEHCLIQQKQFDEAAIWIYTDGVIKPLQIPQKYLLKRQVCLYIHSLLFTLMFRSAKRAAAKLHRSCWKYLGIVYIWPAYNKKKKTKEQNGACRCSDVDSEPLRFKSHYSTWETCSTAFTFTLNDLEMKDTSGHNKHDRLPHDETVKSDSYVGNHENFLYFVSLVKLVGGDLQKRLQGGIGSVIHQEIDGADVPQGCLRGLPIRQVHTYRGDGCTLKCDLYYKMDRQPVCRRTVELYPGSTNRYISCFCVHWLTKQYIMKICMKYILYTISI